MRHLKLYLTVKSVSQLRKEATVLVSAGCDEDVKDFGEYTLKVEDNLKVEFPFEGEWEWFGESAKREEALEVLTNLKTVLKKI